MLKNNPESSSVRNELIKAVVSRFQNNKFLIRFVLMWHCLVPCLISLAVWAITYGHANALREFLVFSGSHMLMLMVTATRINFNENLKNEFLISVPQKPKPDWFEKPEELTKEEI